jgi:hypothetical protein
MLPDGCCDEIMFEVTASRTLTRGERAEVRRLLGPGYTATERHNGMFNAQVFCAAGSSTAPSDSAGKGAKRPRRK